MMKKKLALLLLTGSLVLTSTAGINAARVLEKPTVTTAVELLVNDFKLSIESVDVEISAPEIGWDKSRVIGSYELPIIYGTGDRNFELDLNRDFVEEVEDSLEDFIEDFDYAIDDYLNILDEEDKDLADFALESLNGVEYLAKTSLISEAEGFLSLASLVYTFTGGAHGREEITAFNIDIERQRTLELEDLFKREYEDTYEKKLLEIINDIADKDPDYKDRLYADQAVTDIDDEDFLIADGKLIIFYQLYEIAPYSSGIIYFEIELSEIKDMLNERYAALVFIDSTSILDFMSYE